MRKVKAKVRLFPYQKEFVESQNSHIAFVAGYGAGKSDAIAYRAIKQNIRRRTIDKLKTPVIVVVAPSYKTLNDANYPDFKRILDTYKISYKALKQEFKIVLKGSWAGEFWFRSCDNPDSIVGFDASDAILDEFDTQKPDKQAETWQRINGRLRQCENTTLALGTTPEGFRFTYEKFVKDGMGKIITARTYHNTELPIQYLWNNIFRQYGQNVPNEIPQELVRAYLRYHSTRTFSDKMIYFAICDDIYLNHYTPLLGAYCGGEFVNRSGMRAYYNFLRNPHVIKSNDNWKHKEEILIGIDFNVDPMTCSFSYLDELGNLITFDEFAMYAGNTESVVNRNKKHFEGKSLTYYPDMTGKGRNTSAPIGVTDISTIIKSGAKIIGANNLMHRDSLAIVNKAFLENRCFVMDRCINLINDLDQVITDQYGTIDKSNSKLTHFSDGYRYKVERIFKHLILQRGGVR